MRAEEVLDLMRGRKVLRLNERVFFISRDEMEARRFAEQGCVLHSYQPRAWSEPQLRHYEVHVDALLDTFVVEDLFGNEEMTHVERERLLAMLRERDGVAFAFQENL